MLYNPFLVYCRELAPGTVSLTGDRAQGDDNKHDLHYTCGLYFSSRWLTTLTPEMDLNTLKRFVELWLESKRDRIDTYYNHGPENPIYK